ncbi:hypothetical protein [Nocardia xishanensis]|uniref:hypothetical protein n=1 Tax=Nocardia xishanensis TaxID=238964 RepID=UPI00343DEFAD
MLDFPAYLGYTSPARRIRYSLGRTGHGIAGSATSSPKAVETLLSAALIDRPRRPLPRGFAVFGIRAGTDAIETPAAAPLIDHHMLPGSTERKTLASRSLAGRPPVA